MQSRGEEFAEGQFGRVEGRVKHLSKCPSWECSGTGGVVAVTCGSLQQFAAVCALPSAESGNVDTLIGCGRQNTQTELGH